MILTDRELVRLVDRLSGSIDENRWELARLAAEARDAGLQDYAEIIGRHPRVRRSPWTVRHWARVADFRKTVNVRIDLPFSCWETAARYEDRLPLEQIVDMLDTFSVEAGASVETLRGELNALCGDPEEAEWQTVFKRILPGLGKLVEIAPPAVSRAAEALRKLES